VRQQLIEFRSKSQITLPSEIVKAFNLKPGDKLEIVIEDDTIKIKPVIVVPKSEAWFWSTEWQQEENAVNEEMRAGYVKGYDNVEELFEELDK